MFLTAFCFASDNSYFSIHYSFLSLNVDSSTSKSTCTPNSKFTFVSFIVFVFNEYYYFGLCSP